MKPPLRSDDGPEAWIMYQPLEADFRAKQAWQEYLKRELPHTFFIEDDKLSIVVLRSPEISQEPVPKEKALSVIQKRSQAISLIPNVINVVAKKRSPRRRKIIMAKDPAKPAPATPAVEHPERPKTEEELFTMKMWKTFSAVLGALLLFLLIWHVASCRNCKKDSALPINDKSKGSEQAAVVKQPTRVPTEVPAEAKGVDYQRLVIHNQSQSVKMVTVILKGKEKTFRLNPGEEQAFGTYELTALVMIEGVMQDSISLKRFGTRKFGIRG